MTVTQPRLRLELVPAPNWEWNLRSILPRKGWDEIRKAVYERAGHACEVCGGKGRKWAVEAHEKWAYDDEARVQKLTGVTALCPPCHEVMHMGRALAIGRGEQAAKHLAKINGWDEAQTTAHVEEAFRVWNERSRVAWALDVSWLDTVARKDGGPRG